MLCETAATFLAAFGDGSGFPARHRPTMRAALLVTPTGFRVNEAAATDNRYMVAGTPVDPERAHAQHRAVADTLLALGVPVLLVPGREGLDDAVFPNNVYGTTSTRFVIGAMRHEARRREARREDVRALFGEALRRDIWDLSGKPVVAELTGPLVIDRLRALGFCGLTGRCDRAGAAAMHEAFGLALSFAFPLVPDEYHTNLVLAVLAGRAAILHAPSFADPEAPPAIARAFEGRALLLSDEEKAAFAGNCIAVTPRDVLFSATSVPALRPASRAALEGWGFRLHGVAVDELEKGGGSLRCLIAEVF